MANTQQRHADCLRLLEETGDVERCLEQYPDLYGEILAWSGTGASIRSLAAPEPAKGAALLSRQAVLSTLQQPTGGQRMLQNLSRKAAAALAALTLGLVGVVGAGAAGGPSHPGLVNDVLSSIGVVSAAPAGPVQDNEATETHGTSVSDAVHDSQQSATPGAGMGAVACEAAHDRSTLPEPEQNAPGLQGQDGKEPCSHIGQGKPTATPTATAEAAVAALEVTETPTPNHGQSVSNAVHDAIEASTPGPGRGPAVSEAACTAAHDRSTLPAGAQNAGGGNTKDCTHPNSDGTPGNGNGGSQSQTLNLIQPTPMAGNSNRGGQGGANGGPSPNSNGHGSQNAPVVIQPVVPQQQGNSGKPAGLPPGPPQQAGGGGGKH